MPLATRHFQIRPNLLGVIRDLQRGLIHTRVEVDIGAEALAPVA